LTAPEFKKAIIYRLVCERDTLYHIRAGFGNFSTTNREQGFNILGVDGG